METTTKKKTRPEAKEIKNKYFNVAPGVWGMRILFVNVFMVTDQDSDDNDWVLIDAGLRGSEKKIIAMAETLFGKGTKPSAIILTHGHFDHVGALPELLKVWEVPVYVHPLEMPYVTKQSLYPPPDPTVGGGFMALMSWMFPRDSVNLSDVVKPLLGDHLPVILGWKIIHTPGHAPGHISLFRESDKILIAGDAFCTTKQDSLLSVLLQKEEVYGPPAYFTCDWAKAAKSVRVLAELHPETVAASHGKPLTGKKLKGGLTSLVNHFGDVAVPAQGRYVKTPAMTDETGVVYVPPKKENDTSKILLALSLITIAGVTVYKLTADQQKDTTGKKK